MLPPEGDEDEEEEVEFESPDANTAPSTRNGDEDETDGDGVADEAADETHATDPSQSWPDVHASIKSAIQELGGRVAPKLNWSAPKDATWINPTNSMDCRSANDIYLMLKSSDFITHDLAHWDDDCVADSSNDESLQYTLMLRKHVMINPSVEFRCFVRRSQLIGICQRDLNHFDFLAAMASDLRAVIQDFFEEKLRESFPEESYCFDVYIPAPHRRVWLIDINPWAQRTDPLLFSWLELLTMEVPEAIGQGTHASSDGGFVRLSIRSPALPSLALPSAQGDDASAPEALVEPEELEEESDEEEEEVVFVPEFRLIKKDDPEAYSFNTPQYSAHKLPKDVVEASQSGPGPLREFAEQWREVLAQGQQGG